MNAFLLAAGFGKRFQPYTLAQAKPSLPFLSLPILAYPLYHILNNFSLNHLVVNTHHFPKSIETSVLDVLFEWSPTARFINRGFLNHLQGNFSTYTSPSAQAPVKELVFSMESPHILESAGGIKFAESFLRTEDHFICANADSFIFPKETLFLQDAFEFHMSHGNWGTFVVCPLPGVGETIGGLWSGPNHQIQWIGKGTGPAACRPWHFTGFYILSSQIFSKISSQGAQHIFTDVINPLLDSGRFMTFEMKVERCFELGNLHDYLQATQWAVESLEDYGSTISRILDFYNQDFELKKGCFFDSSCSEIFIQKIINQVSPDSDFLVWGQGAALNTKQKLKNLVAFGNVTEENSSDTLVLSGM